MIKEFVEAWNVNKDILKQKIELSTDHDCWSYTDLVGMLFEYIINPYIEDEHIIYLDAFNIENIHVLDDGDYQGTQIFIVYENGYQPSINSYVMTYVDYGSCSGCDTLQAIQWDGDEDSKPNDEQVEDYMMLCLHLLQRCRWLDE